MRSVSFFSFLAIGVSALTGGCDLPSSSLSSSGGGTAQELVPTNILEGSLANISGDAYFIRVDPELGEQPWISDGTQEGTHILKDIVPGPEFRSSGTPHFTAFGGLVFFFFDDGTHGRELWRTDGTEAGTELVADLLSASTFGRGSVLSASNEKLYMSTSGGIAVLELSDARDGIPVFMPGPFQTFPESLLNVGGMAYHFGYESDFGNEPWISDGTIEATRRIIDIYQGPEGSMQEQPEPVFEGFGGLVYFFADDGIVGRELWRSDGTEAGTELFADLVPGDGGVDHAFLEASEERLFLLTDGNPGDRLWAVELPDGDGMQIVTELTPTNSGIRALENVHGIAYFLLTHPDLGTEVWTSDGTPEGTGLLKDIVPGPGSGAPGFRNGVVPFVAFNGSVYFFSDDGIAGTELWRTDGTEAGTALFADLTPGSNGFSSGSLSASTERLYIEGHRLETGGKLWVIEASP